MSDNKKIEYVEFECPEDLYLLLTEMAVDFDLTVEDFTAKVLIEFINSHCNCEGKQNAK